MNATLNTVFVDVTQVLTGGTLIAVLSSVLLVLLGVAHALPTTTLAMTRTDFAILRVDTVILSDLAAAVRATPAVIADTVAALAGAVLRSSAHLSVVSVTAEVVTLAEGTTHLLRCIAGVALTDAASDRKQYSY